MTQPRIAVFAYNFPHKKTQDFLLRLIVEGSGAYTAVEGERSTMHPGDFITQKLPRRMHSHRPGTGLLPLQSLFAALLPSQQGVRP